MWMLKVDELVKDLEERLRHHNIVTPPQVQPDDEDDLILKVISYLYVASTVC